MAGTTYEIPVWETVTTAWDKVYGTKASFWAAAGIMILIGIGFGILAAIVGAASSHAQPIIQFISSFVNFFLQMGLIYMGIRCAQDLAFTYQDLFYAFRFDLMLKLIGLYILKVLIMLSFFVLIFLGMSLAFFSNILMVIVNILIGLGMLYVSIRMILAGAFILDRDAGPWQALVSSFKATKNNFFTVLAIFIIQAGAIILSVITLGIGFIWVMPFGLILYGLVYKRLLINASAV